ncbi:hypothetical protein KJ684_01065 [Patescibacteria group bacterium]|nr:hypothetical protein [Patescibacteria group bacterium]
MKYLIPVFILIFLTFPSFAHALFGDAQCVLAGSSIGPNTAKLCGVLVKIQRFLLAFGLGAAIIFIIIGGINYMTAGGDDEKVKKAKKFLTNAIIGIAIILVAEFAIEIIKEFVTGSFRY